MERYANHKKIGKHWTNDEWAENAACAFSAYVRNGTAIPIWATVWAEEHEKKDKERKQAAKNRKEAEYESDLRKFNALKRKLGK